MNKKIRKKIIIFILIIVLILLGTFIFLSINTNDNSILSVYSTNEYGLMRNEDNISDEIFDQYGNLIHYKYKQELENGMIIEKEYNIKYTFDSDNRITIVEYDNNYIKIEYDHENRIFKLVNVLKNDSLEKKYEYNFTYYNHITKIYSSKSFISNNDNSNYTINANYTLTETIINDKNYSLCTISENNVEKQKYVFKTLNKEVNYNNIFSLLNIDFEGYVSFSPTIKNSNFTIEFPIFNFGNIISLKYLSNNTSTDFSYDVYYDKNDNILKYDLSLGNDIYYMYEKINNKEYYGYSLEISDSNYNYIKYKDYLNDNGIYKREILEEKLLSENESKQMLTKFEEYFESNK